VREAEFSVYTRVGTDYAIDVIVPNVPWLRLATPLVGPQDPPIHARLIVDTSSLPTGRQYTADLLFRAYGEVIWREPIRVTVAPDNLAHTSQRSQPVNDAPDIWFILVGLVIAGLAILFVLSTILP
jgi:hypothetical protein